MKCMACKVLQGEFVPFEAFQEAQRSFYFTKPENNDVCYVTPYVVVIDGKDILCRYAGIDKSRVEIGWKFPVFQGKDKGADFDKLVEEGIKQRFLGLWKDIRTQTKKVKEVTYDSKQQRILKAGAKYDSLDHDLINVHATNRGCYSLNKKRFHPVYFIVLPNTRPINLIPAVEDPDEKPAYPVDFQTFSHDSGSVPLTYNARKIMEMITSGEIVLPIISGHPEFPE